MANRQIQFEPGMSIPEFPRRFGTEAQCSEAVKLARWPDGLRCPRCAVADAGCIHLPTVVGDLEPRDLPEFKWVNTVLGNLRTILASAFHALKYRMYGEHYLAAFADRFNRRFDLRGLVASLIVDVVRTKPIKEKEGQNLC